MGQPGMSRYRLDRAELDQPAEVVGDHRPGCVDALDQFQAQLVEGRMQPTGPVDQVDDGPFPVAGGGRLFA
jgi:hypothetical protein